MSNAAIDSKVHVCVICHLPFNEFGNNADPIAKGRCCNRCNDTVVIPARIRDLRLAAQAPDGKTDE